MRSLLRSQTQFAQLRFGSSEKGTAARALLFTRSDRHEQKSQRSLRRYQRLHRSTCCEVCCGDDGDVCDGVGLTQDFVSLAIVV